MNKKIKKSDDAQEIANSLRLAISQINMSMQESDESVQQLIASITAMTGCLDHINEIIDNPDNNLLNSNFGDIKKYSHIACKHMQKSVMAFQFYDRLSQRITHVEENLQAIAELMLQPDQQHPELWKNLQQKLRSVYSTEQEQTMYQAILCGISTTEKISRPAFSGTSDTTSDIELF